MGKGLDRARQGGMCGGGVEAEDGKGEKYLVWRVSKGRWSRVWKTALQGLANKTGLVIPVCHFPLRTNKWNKNEHNMVRYLAWMAIDKSRSCYKGNSHTSSGSGLSIRGKWIPVIMRAGRKGRSIRENKTKTRPISRRLELCYCSECLNMSCYLCVLPYS
jgi:hypothetical protein